MSAVDEGTYDQIAERKILLEKLGYDIILKLGQGIGEPYCLQFNEQGYDAQYKRLDTSVAIPKIAERITDDQLVSLLSDKLPLYRAFKGKFYTLRDGKLRVGTEWPSIEEKLLKLVSKHQNNLIAVLGACYQVCVTMKKTYENYLHVEAVAKESGAKNFRTVLTDLELSEVVHRDKGDIEIPAELIPLVQCFLQDFQGGTGEIEEAEEEQVEIPSDLFDIVVGHDRVKKLFTLSLQAPQPVHILLVGPPATAKSIFLMELERLPRSRYALGGTSSKAGIVDYIIEQRPRYLIIDELEKMDIKDYSALLSLMAEGIVTKLKKGMTEKVKVKTWVFGAVNRDDNLPTELKSRFLIRYLPEYSEQDYKKVVEKVLMKREQVAEDIATEIAEKMVAYSRDVRDAIKVARLHKGQSAMTIDQVIELAFGYRSED